MRKLKIIEHISLDGVVQMMTTGPDDDFPSATGPRRIARPLDCKSSTRCTARPATCCWPPDLRLAGELLAESAADTMADRLNAATNYVVTHRPESLEWAPFEAIGSDIVDNVRRIKAKKGPDVIVPGSSTLASVLLDHGLADEVVLLVNPIVLGKGKRFLEGGSLPRGFALGSTRALPSAYSSTSTS